MAVQDDASDIPLLVKELLAPTCAVVDFIAIFYFHAATVERGEESKKLLVLGEIMRVWKTNVSFLIDYAFVVVCVNLEKLLAHPHIQRHLNWTLRQMVSRKTYQSDV